MGHWQGKGPGGRTKAEKSEDTELDHCAWKEMGTGQRRIQGPLEVVGSVRVAVFAGFPAGVEHSDVLNSLHRLPVRGGPWGSSGVARRRPVHLTPGRRC